MSQASEDTLDIFALYMDNNVYLQHVNLSLISCINTVGSSFSIQLKAYLDIFKEPLK